MFDRLKSMFETFSESKEDHKDPTLRTLNFKLGVDAIKEIVLSMLEDLKYRNINYNDSYNEIFATKAGYEVTIILNGSKSGTEVNITVFSLEKKGKTRKALRFLLNELKLRVEENAW